MKNELPNAHIKFPKITQRGRAWCIPAGLEVLLHYFGINNPTQEEMVLEYHARHGNSGYVTRDGKRGYLKKPALDTLKLVGFPKGNFDTFSAIANSLLLSDCKMRFLHPTDCASNFIQYLTKSIDDKIGVLGVIKNPDGNCHILPLIGYELDDSTGQLSTVTTYDPATSRIETRNLADYEFNQDCLLLKEV